MNLNGERNNVVLKIKNGSTTMDSFTLNVQLSTIQKHLKNLLCFVWFFYVFSTKSWIMHITMNFKILFQ